MKLQAGLLAGGVAVLALAASTALAAEFIKPNKETGGNVSLRSEETHHDLYTAGASVTVDSNTTGDLVAAGGMVSVNGSVERDLIIAGGNLTVTGAVGDDARIAGGNVSINGPVSSDLLVAGGHVSIAEAATVGGDLIAAGGDVIVNAAVAGDAKLKGGVIDVNSAITGNVEVRAEEHVTFGSNSSVSGTLVVYGKKQPVIMEGARLPDIDFRELKESKWNYGGVFAGVGFFVGLLAMLVAGFAALYLSRRRVNLLVQSIQTNPWSNLGLGLVGLIVTPVVVVLLFVAVIGYYLALLLLFWYILLILLGVLMGMTFLGAWVVKLVTRQPELKLDWIAILVGAVLLAVLGLIPFVGWIVCFLLLLAGIGSILRLSKQTIKQDSGPQPTLV